MAYRRRYPVGAEVMPSGEVSFRVWAPRWRHLEVVLRPGPEARACALGAEEGGYFSGEVADAAPGMSYCFRLEDGRELPDPASRFQPGGPGGPSEIIDPRTYRWEDGAWPGLRMKGQIVYEMHVGTFTQPGTWEAALGELPHLARLGVTVLELMPVNEFHGKFGWSYDGVDLFAPTRNYGRPDEMRRFVDEAHRLGLGVILDVVYNHVGDLGNVLPDYAEEYFSKKHVTEWGPAFNFDGERSGPVRELFLANARYWIEEFHLDGYRIDAVQAFFDDSDEHIMAAVTRAAREAAGQRQVIIIGENEPQRVRLLDPLEEGGFGMDATWNDDFHHSAMVRAWGHNEAYYSDHHGTPEELIASAKWGWLFQGQQYQWQGKPRGEPALRRPAWQFVNYLQNHDQIANSVRGSRIHQLSSPGRHRTLTALLLLGPQTPHLFQGQELSASAPFLYFNDREREAAGVVVRGRGQFLKQFQSLEAEEIQRLLPNPADPSSFMRSKLDHRERELEPESWRLHLDLLRLRRLDPVFAAQDASCIEGAALGLDALLLRFFGEEQGDRLLLCNFGPDLVLAPIPQPLLAPPTACRWQLIWTSEDPTYGGAGTPPLDERRGWRLPGEAVLVFRSAHREDEA